MAYYGGSTTGRTLTKSGGMALAIQGVLAIGFLGFGVFLIQSDILFKPQAPAAPAVVAPVAAPAIAAAKTLIAIKDIEPGLKLSPGLFRIEDRVLDGLENQLVTNVLDLRGTYSRSLIVAESPLLKAHITNQEPANLLTAKIPSGYRAVAIPVNAETGVEGWVLPGAKVDVVWASIKNGRRFVTVIVENAEVLSAASSTKTVQEQSPNTTKVPNHITLLVPLKDAQRIQLAKTSGTLTLSLRGDNDANQAGPGSISVDRLFKSRELQFLDDPEGRVVIDGKNLVMRNGKLVDESQIAEDEF